MTSILDRLPTHQEPTVQAWPFLVAGLTGAFVVVAFGHCASLDPLTFFLGLVPASYLCVLVHELGHVLAGFSAGFRFGTMVVGPFFLARHPDGWHAEIVPNRILALGGHVIMHPKSPLGLTKRHFWMVAGGPIASLGLLGAVLSLPDTGAVDMVAFIATVYVVLALLPIATATQPTDGRIILRLLQKGPASDRLAAVINISALQAHYLRPQRWPKQWIDKIRIETDDDTFLGAAISIQLDLALAECNPVAVAQALEKALSVSGEVPPWFRRKIFVAASCFQSLYYKNARLAEWWLERARQVKQVRSPKGWDLKASAFIEQAKRDLAGKLP